MGRQTQLIDSTNGMTDIQREAYVQKNGVAGDNTRATGLLLKPLVWLPAPQQELPKAHNIHSSTDADMHQVLQKIVTHICMMDLEWYSMKNTST